MPGGTVTSAQITGMPNIYNPGSQFSNYGVMNPSQFGNNPSQFGTNFASNYGGFASPYNQNAWAQLQMYPPMLQMAQQLQNMSPMQRQQHLMRQASAKQDAQNPQYMQVQAKLNQMRNMQPQLAMSFQQQNVGSEQMPGQQLLPGQPPPQAQQPPYDGNQVQNQNVGQNVGDGGGDGGGIDDFVVPVRGREEVELQFSVPGSGLGNEINVSEEFKKKMDQFTPDGAGD